MNKKLMAAVLATVSVLGLNAVYADADYDYNYDDISTDTTTYGYYDTYSDSSNTDNMLVTDSSTSSESDQPATLTLEPSDIEDYKFSAKLKIDSSYAFTAADITITYDTDVLKLLSNEINEEAGGEGVGAETEDGVFQYQYINSYGSEYEEEYLTLNFEIIDPLERSTVLYMTVNSFLDAEGLEHTTVSDGTVIQIEGAVPVDASMDESSYSELRVYKSEKVIEYSTLGLSDVKSVTFEDGELATADTDGINALSVGITNMTVEFNDGTFKYYRLVINSPDTDSVSDSEASDTALSAETVVSQAAVAVTTTVAGTITKTQTSSNKKVKYFIIYVLVLVAIIALFIEGFTILGNPYRETAKLLKQRKKEKGEAKGFDDDDMFPDSEYDGEEEHYEDDSDDSDDEESREVPEEDTAEEYEETTESEDSGDYEEEEEEYTEQGTDEENDNTDEEE